MWIRFLQDFTYKPTSQSSIDFKTGDTFNAPHERAEQLIAKGTAEETSNGGKGKAGAAEKPASKKTPADEKAESKPANAKGDLAKDQ